MRLIEPGEHKIQASIIQWAHNVSIFKNKEKIGKLSDFLIAIPNGGTRNFLEAKKLKNEGVKRGVSDLFLTIPFDNRAKICTYGLWIEVKSKKGSLSVYQADWFKQMRIVGYGCALVKSLDEFIDLIKSYFYANATYECR